ncbi:MAG: MFS transporter [Candidatus Bathyarchaeota archaeon]|nr:MFS transporter [Candidatus Bathyarchaeota archaeon]
MVKKEILFLCGSSMAVMLGFGIVGPILPQYVLTFNVSYTLAGLVISAFPLARMLFNFPSGILADRIGRRRPLLLGISVVTLGALGCGLAQSIYELILFRFTYGAGTAMFVIVANVLIADIAPTNERGKYLSYYQGSFRFGSIFGPAIGGFIADFAGLRVPFFLLALLGAVSVGLTFLLIQEEPRAHHARARSSINVGSLFRLLVDRRMIAIEVTQMASFITMSSIRTTMLPLYGVDYLGLSSAEIGTILSIGALVSFPTLMIISNVIDRIQRNLIISIGFLGLTTAVFLYPFALDYTFVLVATVILSVSQILINPSKSAIIGDITIPETRGLVMAAFRTAGDVGFFIGPAMAGYLTDNVNVHAPFYLVAILCVLSAMIAFFALNAKRLSQINSIN